MSVRYRTIRLPVEPACLLDEAIRRTVARAIETGELLNIEAEARNMATSYPGMAHFRIADLLMRAAVEARINLELGPRELALSPHPDGPSGEPLRAAAA